MDILALLQCLHPALSATRVRQFSHIVFALLAVTGRITMLSLSRWAGKGGSYRTIQRWFYTALPWGEVFGLFFRQHLFCPEDTYILAGDEVVVPKAGKHTFGLDRFFSSVLNTMIPAVSFFGLSVVSTTEHCAYPLRLEQVIHTDAEKAARKAKAQAKAAKASATQGKPGRPKGSNKNQHTVILTPELQRIQALLQATLRLVGGWLALKYLALDGHFGNHNAFQMVRSCSLELISKLRSDSALYVAYDGPQKARGKRRKYGDKVKYHDLPTGWLKQVTLEGAIETRIYQQQLWHKDFPSPLNVVILVKTNLQTQAWAHVVLFSSDLDLAWDKLIQYYSLRFQIEFNFRDAKQYWGLDDFMNITETAIANAANLSLFMVNVSAVLRRWLHPDHPDFSVLDLKAYGRGYSYALETLKMLPQKPDDDLKTRILRHITTLGSIHATIPYVTR